MPHLCLCFDCKLEKAFKFRLIFGEPQYFISPIAVNWVAFLLQWCLSNYSFLSLPPKQTPGIEIGSKNCTRASTKHFHFIYRDGYSNAFGSKSDSNPCQSGQWFEDHIESRKQCVRKLYYALLVNNLRWHMGVFHLELEVSSDCWTGKETYISNFVSRIFLFIHHYLKLALLTPIVLFKFKKGQCLLSMSPSLI